MWMVESSSNDHENRRRLKMGTDPLLYGRKLRPLMPRPMVMSSEEAINSSSCCCRSIIKNPSRWGLHRQYHDHEKAVAVVSTRWNPTPEQLQALEDMYRRGVRTPSAEQIQQIASKLRRFGKIEGKNVFYWFQNHKARERQKKKRRHDLIINSHSTPGAAVSGVNSRRSHIEIEDHHKLATPSPCDQGSASMQAGAVTTPDHFRQDEWTQLQLLHHHKEKEKELQKINNIPSAAANNEQDESSSISNHQAAPPHHNNHTLHLFPIVATTSLHPIPHPAPPSTVQTISTPNHFIEFLPLKSEGD